MHATRPTKPPRVLAFGDVESTGLDPFLHDPWEVAVVLRVDGRDEEHVFRIEPDLTNADPESLRINRYFERTSAPGWKWDDRETAARHLYELLDGAVLIGSNPAFDAEMLTHLLGRYFDNPRPWHYRTIDVVTLAAGSLYGRAAERARRGVGAWFPRITAALGWPWRSYDVSRLVEVEPPAPDVGHTALPDARWVRDLWDRLTVPWAVRAATDEELAAMAGDALARLNGGRP
ncbi:MULTISPECIES: exonuclease domain-containing protein [unclassified Streptomyces]|uniref:3'-5' exonuclease n=1 Tax=unclassified Streptomyces TaxID=2593676 RepID=UPI0036EA99DD